jgi:N-acetylmuramoyl-L-alanine amidase
MHIPSADGFPELDLFDDVVDEAVRSFQQSRGLRVDGIVGPGTARALDEAARSLGDRLLYHSVSHPFVGDDVLELQSRLADMGFDVGRVDGIFGNRTEGALREFQRNRGLAADGACGPVTLRELTRLQRTVVGGRPYELREDEQLRRRGPSLAGKTVVLDPGHGGTDAGWEVGNLNERDLMHDLACQLEGRLLAVGVNAFLTHHPRENPSDEQRSGMANETARAGRRDLLLRDGPDEFGGRRAIRGARPSRDRRPNGSGRLPDPLEELGHAPPHPDAGSPARTGLPHERS